MVITLSSIVAATRQRVDLAKRTTDLRVLESSAESHIPRGFRHALERKACAGMAVIAELKKASPSRGMIRGSLHVSFIASELERAGAAALSILTEEQFFHGGLADLAEASAATHIPCLRKDFIIDEFQLLEARAHGADAVLLILASLDDPELPRLYGRSRELGLDALCEVHEEKELERALKLDPKFTDARFDLASVEAEGGQWEAAAQHFKQVLAERPQRGGPEYQRVPAGRPVTSG